MWNSRSGYAGQLSQKKKKKAWQRSQFPSLSTQFALFYFAFLQKQKREAESTAERPEQFGRRKALGSFSQNLSSLQNVIQSLST